MAAASDYWGRMRAHTGEPRLKQGGGTEAPPPTGRRGANQNTSVIFAQRNGKCLKTPRLYSFEINRKQHTIQDVKLNALQIGHLGFGKKAFYFVTENFEIWFQKLTPINCIILNSSQKRNTCYKTVC